MARRVAVGLFLAAICASCARPSGPVEIPPDELPFVVAREPTPSESPVPARTFDIYLTRGGRLHAVRRRTTENVPPVEAALRALIEGPTPSERARGLRSRLPADVELLASTITGGTATADLSSEFQRPATPEEVAMRVAQVTWTMTGVPGVEQVLFAIDGELVSVTTPDGTTVSRPVGRADYAVLSPQP